MFLHQKLHLQHHYFSGHIPHALLTSCHPSSNAAIGRQVPGSKYIVWNVNGLSPATHILEIVSTHHNIFPLTGKWMLPDVQAPDIPGYGCTLEKGLQAARL